MEITAFGQTLLVDEWSKRTGIKPATIIARIYSLGWSPDDAVSTSLSAKAERRNEDYVAILTAAAAGEYAHETADRLGWSEDRVLRVRRMAIKTAGARNLTHAVAMALRNHLIKI